METAIPATPARSPAAPQDWLGTVIEHNCREFAGRLTRECILDVSREVAARFRGARVTAYVPILVSRFTRERLLQQLAKDDVK